MQVLEEIGAHEVLVVFTVTQTEHDQLEKRFLQRKEVNLTAYRRTVLLTRTCVMLPHLWRCLTNAGFKLFGVLYTLISDDLGAVEISPWVDEAPVARIAFVFKKNVRQTFDSDVISLYHFFAKRIWDQAKIRKYTYRTNSFVTMHFAEPSILKHKEIASDYKGAKWGLVSVHAETPRGLAWARRRSDAQRAKEKLL